MTIEIIKDGDKDKQGDAICTGCGKVVLIKDFYGDPPKCSECDIPYRPITRPIKWE